MPRTGRPPQTDALTPFGVRLRELIALSPHVKNRQHLCKLAGIDQSHLRRKEVDPDNPPPLDWLVAFGRILRVSLDELYPTPLTSSEPPYEGWVAFRKTELGKAISEAELDDLARIRPRHHVLTVEFYISTLMALRGTRIYAEPHAPSSPPHA